MGFYLSFGCHQDSASNPARLAARETRSSPRRTCECPTRSYFCGSGPRNLAKLWYCWLLPWYWYLQSESFHRECCSGRCPLFQALNSTHTEVSGMPTKRLWLFSQNLDNSVFKAGNLLKSIRILDITHMKECP